MTKPFLLGVLGGWGHSPRWISAALADATRRRTISSEILRWCGTSRRSRTTDKGAGGKAEPSPATQLIHGIEQLNPGGSQPYRHPL